MKTLIKHASYDTNLSILTTSASRMLRRTCSTGISPAYPAPQPKVLDRSFPVPRGKMVTRGINWSWPWEKKTSRMIQVKTNRMKIFLETKTAWINLQLHRVDGIQHPAHRTIAPAHQHPHTVWGEQGTQLQSFGGRQLGQVKHLQDSERNGWLGWFGLLFISPVIILDLCDDEHILSCSVLLKHNKRNKVLDWPEQDLGACEILPEAPPPCCCHYECWPRPKLASSHSRRTAPPAQTHQCCFKQLR